MSDEKIKDAEKEAAAKETITVAEKNSGNTATSTSKETITVAEKASGS